jgi:hypothetical protein
MTVESIMVISGILIALCAFVGLQVKKCSEYLTGEDE